MDCLENLGFEDLAEVEKSQSQMVLAFLFIKGKN
jgi:hypothetical protein